MSRTVSLSILGAIIFLQIHFSNGQTASDVSVAIMPSLVTEGGLVTATFTLQVPPGENYQITVTSNTPAIDVNQELTFTPTELEIRIENIMVLVDSVISGTITYNPALTVTGEDGSTAQGGLLIVNEGTVLTANFVQPSYTFAEGDNGEVCVRINGTTTVDLEVELQLEFDTASAEDVLSTTGMVEFTANTENMMVCTSTNPLLDSLVEMPETFRVRISSVTAPAQIGSEDVTMVTVLDLQTNCGELPAATSDFNITISGPATTSMTGSLVANGGATATYQCSNPMELLSMATASVLTCMVDGSSASWSPSTAPMCELGNCGPLPESASSEGLELTLGGQTRMENGVLVAYRGASATYSCPSENCMLMGEERLSCNFINNTAVWYPSMAPYCDCTTMTVSTTASANTMAGAATDGAQGVLNTGKSLATVLITMFLALLLITAL